MTIEAACETLKIERPGRGLLRVTLARPDRSNSINSVMLRELTRTLNAAETDPDVRLVAFYGDGKHFCSGAEIGGESSAGEGRGQPAPKFWELLLQVDRLSKPTVVFTHGACLGAALALTSCADVAIAAPDAFFAMPEVRIGMAPGLLPFFVRAIGPRAFRRYGLSGERFDARVAERCGLIGEIVAREAWPALEGDLLDAYLQAGPQTLALIKREARRWSGGFDIGADLFDESKRLESPEAAEGKASFKEKRKPSWWIGA